MRFLSAGTLLAAAAAVLLKSSPSSANKLASQAYWPNHPDVVPMKRHIDGEGGLRTAVVKYKGIDGHLKCTPNVERHYAEIKALEVYDEDFRHIFHYTSFPTMLGSFPTRDGYHCLVLEPVKGPNLREFMAQQNGRTREKIAAEFAAAAIPVMMYLHREAIVHGNINPNNIIIRAESVKSSRLQFAFTGFERSRTVSDQPQASIPGERGYNPPEDYNQSSVDQYRRDVWMLGATLYFITNGMPPYGYTKKHGAIVPVSNKKMLQAMEKAAKTGKRLFPPINAEHKGLISLMSPLLACKAEDRVGTFTLKDFLSLSDSEPEVKKSFLQNMWIKLRAKLMNNKVSAW
ncbi:kinase-like domain-containing protein [Thamnocephalis sphaerospora]|uniref:Kinase-like domain-containing protein n=1 Tax=Thamnocephalis sphaerospora TaxID=78915 RepID=A0A4P9XTY3_9FUNG|nr:kinase-like domain-containing protein [Thamnocephalis sphaerospora]|eukprot:RKP08890.1 kinase-like domain-containing protein [Thamnocephalis sphaerospora]